MSKRELLEGYPIQNQDDKTSFSLFHGDKIIIVIHSGKYM